MTQALPQHRNPAQPRAQDIPSVLLKTDLVCGQNVQRCHVRSADSREVCSVNQLDGVSTRIAASRTLKILNIINVHHTDCLILKTEP